MDIQAIKAAGYAEALFEDAKEAAFSEARASFTPIVNEVAERGSRYFVTKHGRPTAAIVPINDLLRLMQLDRTERGDIDIDFSEVGDAVEFEDKKANVLDEREAQEVAELVTRVSQIPGVKEYLEDDKRADAGQGASTDLVTSEKQSVLEAPATGP